MNQLIVSYKSRNNLIAFARILGLYGISSTKINTPHSISVSCGMSLKVDYRYLNTIINIVQTSNLSGFMGIYLYSRNGTQERVDKIF